MKCIVIISCLLSIVLTANAQPFRNYFSVSYDVNKPLSGTDVANDISFQGAKVGFRKLFNNGFMAGVDFSYATYDDYIPRDTYTFDNGALTTDFYPYAYSYGLTVAGDYLFARNNRLSPFIGVGVGASFIDYTLYYNVFSNSDTQWGFLVRPEAGLLLRLGSREAWGLTAGVHYDYSTAKNERLGYDDFSNVGASVGIVVFAH